MTETDETSLFVTLAIIVLFLCDIAKQDPIEERAIVSDSFTPPSLVKGRNSRRKEDAEYIGLKCYFEKGKRYCE